MNNELIRSLVRSTLGPVAELLVTLRYAGHSQATVVVPQVSADQVPDFPIDLVYTWVDGNDPAWLTDKQRYQPELEKNPLAS